MKEGRVGRLSVAGPHIIWTMRVLSHLGESGLCVEQTDIEVTSTEAKGQWRHRNGLIECREVCTLPWRASALLFTEKRMMRDLLMLDG